MINPPAHQEGLTTEQSTSKQYPSHAMKITMQSRLPGRVRFKVPRLRHADAVRQKLETALTALQGMRKVEANTLTCSLLIICDPDLPLQDIIRYIEKQLGKSVTTDLDNTNSDKVIHIANRLRNQRQKIKQAVRSQAEDLFYTYTIEYLLKKMEVSPELGLNLREVELRYAKFGANALPEEKERSELSMLINQFMSLPVGLLGVSAFISVLTGGLADAAAILTVVGINAAIGFYTERQAERTINALKSITPTSARVLRDGMTLDINISEVVIGDILLLIPGDYIAADARLLECSRMMLDESALTGESMPVEKDELFIGKEDTPLADRRNMLYMGTMVTGGSGMAVVVATGINTVIGQIQGMVNKTRPPITPMQNQLNQLSTQLAILSGTVCMGVFGIGLLRGHGALEMLKVSISLAVAAVPEGLPAVATSTLAIGIRNMRKHKVAVRHIDAVETLGSVQIFCLDKTGTLTTNHMTAVEVSFVDRNIIFTEGKFWSDGRLIDSGQIDELLRLAQVVSLCSESELNGLSERLSFNGSPTENALLELAMRAGINITDIRRRFPRLQVQYRSEGKSYMITAHRLPGGRFMHAIKGSPAELLQMCTSYQKNGKKLKLTNKLRRQLTQDNERMAGNALRVLATAYAYSAKDGLSEAEDITWLGMIGMTDPLRTGMSDLMSLFHNAGIQTVMITGDQSATAYAIGKQLNLSNGKPIQIMDSTNLENIDPNLLVGLVKKVHVFSRVSPAHKLEIVQAFQKSGHIVAMTGDGINDGPALKAANIGVAMGVAGTDVARSVADVVLEDDNLHTMFTAVSQGRTIYNNIRKTIHFLLSTNFSEIEVMLVGILMGQHQPLNPMQLLWINLITDIFPGLALSMEEAEPDIQLRSPRDPQESIINKQDLWNMSIESVVITASTLMTYIYALRRYGPGAQASTHAFTTLTLTQLVQAIGCRSETHSIYRRDSHSKNRYLDLALGGSLFVQILASKIPGLRKLLGITPLGVLDSIVIAAGVFTPLFINETIKDVRIQKTVLSKKTKTHSEEIEDGSQE